MGSLNLEHRAPGDPANPATGDVWSRLAESRRRLASRQKHTQEFDMPLDGLIVRYHRLDMETYRATVEADAEWERWAQLLIDACDGFRVVDADDDLVDGMGSPVLWDTLAERIGVTVDAKTGARGLVLDVFGGDEGTLVKHAQRVDDWLVTPLADDEAALAKGS